MEEKNKIIDDDIEILNFDDDVIEESPKKDTLEPEFIEIEEIIFDDENEEQNEIQPTIDTTPTVIGQQEKTLEEEYTPTEEQNNLFADDNALKDNKNNVKIQTVTKRKIKWKSVILGILIFTLLLGTIIALPFMSNYFNNSSNQKNNNYSNSSNNSKKEFKSNIDVKTILESLKNYGNYQYQNINIVSTKDDTGQLISVKNKYIYNFNETKFNVELTKTISDFDYITKDYYEKLNDTYNLYLNDITTNSYNKRNTTSKEFNKITNMFPNIINYLIENYNISEEKQIIVDKEQHINITLKVSKNIVDNMSIETDRIQNRIDSTKLTEDFIYVNLYFDENKKIYKVEIEIEDINACQEKLENTIESAILRYVFTDFNKIDDITLPSI